MGNIRVIPLHAWQQEMFTEGKNWFLGKPGFHRVSVKKDKTGLGEMPDFIGFCSCPESVRFRSQGEFRPYRSFSHHPHRRR